MVKNDIDSVLVSKGFSLYCTTPITTIATKGNEKITLRFSHSGDCTCIICERIDSGDSLKLLAKEKYGAVIETAIRGDELVFSLSKTSYRAEIIL